MLVRERLGLGRIGSFVTELGMCVGDDVSLTHELAQGRDVVIQLFVLRADSSLVLWSALLSLRLHLIVIDEAEAIFIKDIAQIKAILDTVDNLLTLDE